MLKKVDPETFEVIRQPYMKYSDKIYFLITTALYLINFISALTLMFSSYNDQLSTMVAINEIMVLWKSPIQAIFKFLLPGLLFYLGCNYFQKE
jgi:hypothetical protein